MDVLTSLPLPQHSQKIFELALKSRILKIKQMKFRGTLIPTLLGETETLSQSSGSSSVLSAPAWALWEGERRGESFFPPDFHSTSVLLSPPPADVAAFHAGVCCCYLLPSAVV